jgi:hypothetical protein
MRIRELWEDDRERCEEMGKGVIASLKEMGVGGVSTSTSPTLWPIIDPYLIVFLADPSIIDPDLIHSAISKSIPAPTKNP